MLMTHSPIHFIRELFKVMLDWMKGNKAKNSVSWNLTDQRIEKTISNR